MKTKIQAGVISYWLIACVRSWFLIPCWPILSDRIDPIVSPGKVSGHVHQIVGGGGIAPNMTYNDTQTPGCTTCFVTADRSNYWIPALYYQHGNKSFERVSQLGSASIYYLNERSRVPSNESIESMPEGIRIVAGDPFQRAPSDPLSQVILYSCLNYSGVSFRSSSFPLTNCPDGLRAEVTFPSCWNGVDLDSPDHKSHMSYPSKYTSGACPVAFPHRLVTLRVEFIFDTNMFSYLWADGAQPFVWSHGDPTGFGLHADYFMGWNYSLLASAVDRCDDPAGLIQNCIPFTDHIQTAYTDPGWCIVQPFVHENIGGVLERLPGCNPVQAGPQRATNQYCQAGCGF